MALDPAAGTGTYPLTAIQHGLDLATNRFGKAMAGNTAARMARNIHAFELLVGPYAVAHLRLSERVMDAGGTLPDDGIHVYLTDALESPHASPPGRFPLVARELTEEHERALAVKKDTEVLVCFGNPPYDRQQIDPSDEGVERKGGWVRNGDDENEQPLLEDFLQPAREAGAGVHLKNLYNDYVYFWRWALWKVFEARDEPGPGIVSFITASSYLRGPGSVGMREVMRRTFDELWILDLEGDNLGARKTENVFNIQTPVAIAVGVRHGEPQPDEPATVSYAQNNRLPRTEARRPRQRNRLRRPGLAGLHGRLAKPLPSRRRGRLLRLAAADGRVPVAAARHQSRSQMAAGNREKHLASSLVQDRDG